MEDREQLYLKSVDRVVIPKSELDLVQHHGIYAGRDAHGQHWFLENNWKNGIQYTPSTEFFNNVPADKIRVSAFEGDNAQRTAALVRAKSRLGEKYNLFLYNCEHYCNEVQYGKARSVQILAALVLAILTFLLIRSSSRSYNS